MEHTERNYLPAAGRDWGLPFYDPMVRLIGADSARKLLLDQANIQPGDRILDIGCGTGTLMTLVKTLYPDAHVVGLDPDPKALRRAEAKVARAGLTIQFDQGFSDAMPYVAASFNRVFSSFMFHHLHADQRQKTLAEARRVLVPQGSLHMADFASSEDRLRRPLSRLLHSSAHLKENSDGRILALMKGAGFADWKKVAEKTVLFGLLRVAYYQASVE